MNIMHVNYKMYKNVDMSITTTTKPGDNITEF